MTDSNVAPAIDEKSQILKQAIIDDFFTQYHAMTRYILNLPLTPEANNVKVKALDHLNDCFVWVKAELLPAIVIVPVDPEAKEPAAAATA